MKHVSFKLVYPNGPTLSFEFWAGYIGNGLAGHALDEDNQPRCRMGNKGRKGKMIRPGRRSAPEGPPATITCKRCLGAIMHLKQEPAMQDWHEE